MQTFGEPMPGIDYVARLGSYAICEWNGDIAVVARQNGSAYYYELPGGTHKYNEDHGRIETSENAVVREVEEETGLIVEPNKLLAETEEYYRRSGGNHAVLRAFGWACRIRSFSRSKMQPGHRLRWFPPHLAASNVRLKSHRFFITEWLVWEDRDQNKYGRSVASSDFKPNWHDDQTTLEIEEWAKKKAR
jgi:8-oxo-dGTP pyrophosphatase MutT (NUDIX family)